VSQRGLGGFPHERLALALARHERHPEGVKSQKSKEFMDNEKVLFIASVGILVLYLFFSALTEMGTKFPWKNKN